MMRVRDAVLVRVLLQHQLMLNPYTVNCFTAELPMRHQHSTVFRKLLQYLSIRPILLLSPT